MASGEHDEETAWRDLIAHYDAPVESGASPWPEREELPPPGGAGPGSSGHVTGSAWRVPGTSGHIADSTDNVTLRGDRASGHGDHFAGRPDAHGGRPDAHGGRPDDDHYVPPPPPALPKLDPIAKGAWLGVTAGPAYLLIATAVGWTVPAVAGFCAIAAFVGGFAVLVMRMGDPPRGSGPDDGAVV